MLSAKRTVMGVPGVNVPGLPTAPPVAQAPAAPVPHPIDPLANVPSSKRTMLGVAAPGGLQVGDQFVPAPGISHAAAPDGRLPIPGPSVPAPPKVEVSATAFQVADPSIRVPTTAAGAFGAPAAGAVSRHAPTAKVDPSISDSFTSIPPVKSRTGMVVAIIIGLLAAAGVAIVLVFRDDIFGEEEATTSRKPRVGDAGVAVPAAADGAVVAVAAAADAAVAPPPVVHEPPKIEVVLDYSGDGAKVELVFGAIEFTTPGREVRLAAGPLAGTPDAVLTPGKRAALRDFLPAGTEPAPGAVKIPLDVTFGDGVVERTTIELPVPVLFAAALVPDAPAPAVRIAFRLAGEGRTLEVAGTPVDVQADGAATYEQAVEGLRGREGIWAEAGDRVELSLPFVVRDGAGVVAEGKAGVAVPVVPLRVDFPASGSLTTDEAIWVRGETAAGAALTLDGAAVTVGEAGAFAIEVPLAAGTERTLALAATAPGALGRSASLAVRRVTPRELSQAADEWAAGVTERLGYADFAGAADSFRGRKVDLLGRITSVPSARDGVSSFVLYVDTASGCGASEVCAVMVHAPSAQALAERDEVRVLGEIVGRERTTSERFPELAAVRAVYVVPR
ncbi:MAG: hypothetical protein HY907_09710 [Deltaproteobacteria bacterium]|nr:hypothetical protein [Deltaproteobacteria bacterium]